MAGQRHPAGRGGERPPSGRGRTGQAGRRGRQGHVERRRRKRRADRRRGQRSPAGRDDIDLSAPDADTGRRGNQDFDFGGTTAGANSVWYVKQKGGVLVRADHDGDAKADFEIWVDGVSRLGAGDFLF